MFASVTALVTGSMVTSTGFVVMIPLSPVAAAVLKSVQQINSECYVSVSFVARKLIHSFYKFKDNA